MKKSFANMLKYEYLIIARSDKNLGLYIYAIGLPFIAYFVRWVSSSSDATLGLSFLSICAINILYAPRQFTGDQVYYEGFFTKNIDFKILVRTKLLFIQLVNLLMFLFLIPLFIVFFDSSRILLFISFFFYTLGFASPIATLITGLAYKYTSNSFQINSNQYNIGLRYLIFGLLPFLPEVFIGLIFSSNIAYFIAINIFLGLIGLIATNKICQVVKSKILCNKYLL